jgi:hypothetical protein
VSDIGGAYLLLDQSALYETPPYVRTWRMRGRGDVTPFTQTGDVAHDDVTVSGAGTSSPSPAGTAGAGTTETVTGAGTAPTTPPGAVTHQTVALAGGAT